MHEIMKCEKCKKEFSKCINDKCSNVIIRSFIEEAKNSIKHKKERK